MTIQADTLRSWMSAVTSISRSVNATESLDVILDAVAELGRTLVGFDYCGVMLDDTTHELMEIAGSSGLISEYLDLVRSEGWLEIHPASSATDLPATRAYREGRTIVVPNVRDEPKYERLQQFALAQGYQSILTAPLRVADATVGILAGYFIEPHDYESEEIELAELLAEQTANAVQTARLRAEQQGVITELSAANAELQQRRASLEWADQQHRRLMQLVLNDIGLDGLTSALADMLAASVTIHDLSQRSLAEASAGVYLAPPKLDKRAMREHQNPDRFEAVRVAHSELETWLSPIVLSGEVVGRLWVVCDPRPPDAGRQRLMERFALVVGLEILKQRHVIEVQERLSGDLMVDLLRRDGVAQPLVLIQRAQALGHDLTTPHWLAVFSADFGPGIGQLARTVRELSQPHQALVGVYAGGLIMLISCEQDPVPIVRRVHKHLVEHVKIDGVAAALTPRIEQLSDYADNYQLGVRTARLRSSTGGSGLMDLRHLPLTSLLVINDTVPEQLRKFAEGLIAPLAVHDARRDTELVATLRAWLKSGFSTAATATALVVHTNTVGYRISKIEGLVARDIRSSQTRLELQLAMDVWDILRGEDAQPATRAVWSSNGSPGV